MQRYPLVRPDLKDELGPDQTATFEDQLKLLAAHRIPLTSLLPVEIVGGMRELH